MDAKSDYKMCQVYQPLQEATMEDYKEYLQNPDSFILYSEAVISHMKEQYMAYQIVDRYQYNEEWIQKYVHLDDEWGNMINCDLILKEGRARRFIGWFFFFLLVSCAAYGYYRFKIKPNKAATTFNPIWKYNMSNKFWDVIKADKIFR